MKYTITILAVLFCSCTSSGKLTDATFPYHFKYTPEPGTILNAGKINMGYAFSATPPSTVGSYSVIATINDRNYFGDKYKKGQDDTIKYALIFAGIALSILLAVFLFIRKRDEEITMPDDEDDLDN